MSLMEPLQADQDEAMAWIKKGRGLTAGQTDTDVGRGHLWRVWSHCRNVYYLITLIPICFLSFTAHSQSHPPPPAVLAFSVSCVHLHHSPQSLPLSAAGYREGEGKPGGADRALFQGAAWTGSLWQHQERRHTRPNVSKLRQDFGFVGDASNEPSNNWVL